MRDLAGTDKHPSVERGIMTDTSATSVPSHISQDRELRDDELDAVAGGNSVSAALKAIGDGLQHAARDSGPETVTIFGVVITLPPPK
jgi:hypothetical protein